MAKLILLAFLFVFGQSHAEPLVVAINQTLKQTDPELTDRIKTALISTGIELEFVEMPSERVIRALEFGKVDIDPYRNQQAVENINNIIQIKPKIDSKTYYLYTSNQRKELCKVRDSDLLSFSVVGILGVRLFDSYIYPKFGSFLKVVDIEQSMNLVAIQRYDFGVWEQSGLEQVATHKAFDQLYVCDSDPLVTVDFLVT